MSRFLRLRKATPDDIEFICALEAVPGNTYVHSWTRATHLEKMDDPHSHYLIAEGQSGERLAFAILFDDGPGRIEWRRIIVETPGAGTGTAFMRAVINYFRKAGTRKIWLDVYEKNTRARHVYKSIGFRELRREPLKSDSSITLVIMELSFV